MKHLVSAFLFLCASLAWSQSSITGGINSSGSTCPINVQASNCVVLQLPAFSSTVGVSILGTYSATLQFEVSADFGASWVNATAIPQPVAAGVTSATSTGTWQVNVAGMSHVRIRGSAYTSGTANISLAAASGIGLSPAVPATGASSSAVQGAGASGSALSGNPVLVGGSDGTNARTLGTDNLGDLSIIHNVTSGDGISAANVGAQLAFSGNNSNGFAPNVSALQFNGTSWDRQFYCSKTTFISALAAATTQIVAGVASQKIRVCSVVLSNTNATATNVKFVEGTGSNCATGQTQTTGNFALGATPNTLTLFPAASGAFITTTAADALCATGSAAGAADVTITYQQF